MQSPNQTNIIGQRPAFHINNFNHLVKQLAIHHPRQNSTTDKHFESLLPLNFQARNIPTLHKHESATSLQSDFINTPSRIPTMRPPTLLEAQAQQFQSQDSQENSKLSNSIEKMLKKQSSVSVFEQKKSDEIRSLGKKEGSKVSLHKDLGEQLVKAKPERVKINISKKESVQDTETNKDKQKSDRERMFIFSQTRTSMKFPLELKANSYFEAQQQKIEEKNKGIWSVNAYGKPIKFQNSKEMEEFITFKHANFNQSLDKQKYAQKRNQVQSEMKQNQHQQSVKPFHHILEKIQIKPKLKTPNESKTPLKTSLNQLQALKETSYQAFLPAITKNAQLKSQMKQRVERSSDIRQSHPKSIVSHLLNKCNNQQYQCRCKKHLSKAPHTDVAKSQSQLKDLKTDEKLKEFNVLDFDNGNMFLFDNDQYNKVHKENQFKISKTVENSNIMGKQVKNQKKLISENGRHTILIKYKLKPPVEI